MVRRFSSKKYLDKQEQFNYFDGFPVRKYQNGSFIINKNEVEINIPNETEMLFTPPSRSDGVEVILTNSDTENNIQYSLNRYNNEIGGYTELKSPSDVHKGHILAKNLFKKISRNIESKAIRIAKTCNLVYMSEWCNCANHPESRGQRFFEHLIEHTLNINKEIIYIWYKVKPIYDMNFSKNIPVAIHIQAKILNNSTVFFQREGKEKSSYGNSFNVLVPNIIELKT